MNEVEYLMSPAEKQAIARQDERIREALEWNHLARGYALRFARAADELHIPEAHSASMMVLAALDDAAGFITEKLSDPPPSDFYHETAT